MRRCRGGVEGRGRLSCELNGEDIRPSMSGHRRFLETRKTLSEELANGICTVKTEDIIEQGHEATTAFQPRIHTVKNPLPAPLNPLDNAKTHPSYISYDNFFSYLRGISCTFLFSNGTMPLANY